MLKKNLLSLITNAFLFGNLSFLYLRILERVSSDNLNYFSAKDILKTKTKSAFWHSNSLLDSQKEGVINKALVKKFPRTDVCVCTCTLWKDELEANRTCGGNNMQDKD